MDDGQMTFWQAVLTSVTGAVTSIFVAGTAWGVSKKSVKVLEEQVKELNETIATCMREDICKDCRNRCTQATKEQFAELEAFMTKNSDKRDEQIEKLGSLMSKMHSEIGKISVNISWLRGGKQDD